MEAFDNDKYTACLRMIRHYKVLLLRCREQYDDLEDFYIVYDYYMTVIEKYEKLLDELSPF